MSEPDGTHPALDPEPYADLGVLVVPDIVHVAGPLRRIYTALVGSPRERTLAVACEMPFPPPNLLRRLAGAREVDVVIARSARGYERLCAVYGQRGAEPPRARIE